MGHACKIFSYVLTDVNKNILSSANFYFPVFFNNRGCIQEKAQTDVIVTILPTKIRGSITPTLQLFATEKEGKLILVSEHDS